MVKSLNQLPAKLLASDPVEHGGRRVMFLAGDDGRAVGVVAKLVGDLGFAPIALGTLAGVGHSAGQRRCAHPSEPGETGVGRVQSCCSSSGSEQALVVRRVIAASNLTPAQAQVCHLLHTAHSQVGIAKILKIAPATVTDRVQKVYDRLDMRSVMKRVTLMNGRV
ncbi:hypothetical protein PEC18_03355 [Paucibacter sp. O1-1]|nr:hypothetical protein [Paucibacter sp. O1-1]MDA3824917.1 hypothetical protein [Paucibacter sp. O1-1]